MIQQRWMVPVTLLCLGLSLPNTTRADATSDARKALQALYDKMDAAAQKKDVAGATASVAPDCVIVDKKGKTHTLVEERQQMQQLFQVFQSLKSTSHIQKVSVQGKNATATVSQHIVANAINPQTHAKTVFDAQEVSRDTWIKTSTGWRMKRSETLSEKATVNGQEIKQP